MSCDEILRVPLPQFGHSTSQNTDNTKVNIIHLPYLSYHRRHCLLKIDLIEVPGGTVIKHPALGFLILTQVIVSGL